VIIADEMKIRRRKVKAVSKRTGQEKVYEMYFVVFSIKFNDILKDVRELRNVEIVTDKKRYFLKSATVYKYSDYKRVKTGEKIPLYAIVIPKKNVAKELINMGIKKVKIIAEVAETENSNQENQNTTVTGSTANNTSTNTPDNTIVVQVSGSYR
jgi:hypothetical protein